AANDETAQGGAGVQNFAANLRIFCNAGVATTYNADIVFEPIAATNPDPTGDPFYKKQSGYGNARIPATFQDGTSNTITFLTRYANNTASGTTVGEPNCSSYA